MVWQKFGQAMSLQDFDCVDISLASPEQIRSWSYGEVKKPETINYRTFKPERDGLFCARIFGPTKDFECGCGKYKRQKHRGVVCERCGVEVTLARVRRERMGHIDLAAPVAHIWFFKSLPSRIGLLLDLTLRDLERVIYFDSHIVIEPGTTPLKMRQLLTDQELMDARDEYGEDAFTVSIGAEAVELMLKEIDLQAERVRLSQEMEKSSSDMRKKKLLKSVKVVDSFISSGVRPEWMILKYLPILPPELRPLVPLDGGRFATSDLNDLYRRVINRNNRLKRLVEIAAPDIIVRNEKRMLQESVDALFDNSRRGRAITNTQKRPLKSLSDILKGKQGRFRQNLLGKRVDYSGRSVIVVGPELKLHQCGLPKKMALELFKPFVYARLEKYGLATSLKVAKRAVERESPEVWDILEEVIREHPVLLNRAPTLHRLSIQAFEPVLVEGKAIRLHPLVCTAFNADFDGDQMGVHVPLSIEAQLEARVLMLSTNNILSPSSGKPIIMPSKDMVLGLYCLTRMSGDQHTKERLFSGLAEVEYALERGDITLHTPIVFRWEKKNEQGESFAKRVSTTAGRVILSSILPDHPQIDFDAINRTMNAKEVSVLIDLVYRCCGQKETVVFADRIMAMGFHYATQGGVSFGKDDLVVSKDKYKVIEATQKKVDALQSQYNEGLITDLERYNKVIDMWSRCDESITSMTMEELSRGDERGPNAVYMMSDSGARGSRSQIKQLVGMRGMMAKPSGEIIEAPIKANFKEGLSVLDYFTSTHGARKGLADTALKTANSGYLTRRLVDVAQDCIVKEQDCGTSGGLVLTGLMGDGGESTVPLHERVLGRVLAQDVCDEKGKCIFSSGTLVDESVASSMKALSLDAVKVRSVLTCETHHGVCVTCYGRDLSRGTWVNEGEAVGVIAAQSIGEPGTQLTMRTFHIGGVAQGGAERSLIETSIDGTVVFERAEFSVNSQGDTIVLNRHMEIALHNQKGMICGRYRVPYGAKLMCQDGQSVEKGTILAEWDPYTMPLLSESEGYIHFEDLIDGISMREATDDVTGVSHSIVIDWKQGHNQKRRMDLKPRIHLRDDKGANILLERGMEARYFLDVNMILNIQEGKFVKRGDVLARLPKESVRTRDITGGLPRVSNLLEARLPRDPAIMAEFSGTVQFGKDFKGKRRLVLTSDQDEQSIEYIVPKGAVVIVRDGEAVTCGDILVDGQMNPHDILRVQGLEDLASFLTREIQSVYYMQGVRIDDKHIEVIIRQMLQMVEILTPGDTDFLVGHQIHREELEAIHKTLASKGQSPATYRPILQGVTKAALHTRSFISAASFQETIRVLIDASISGRRDHLEGLKENVIVGRLVPAGTGHALDRLIHQARLRDQEVLEKQAAHVAHAGTKEVDHGDSLESENL